MEKQLAVFEEHVLSFEKMSEGMMTDEAAETMYSIALSLWKNKQYQKASDAYALLFMFRPRNPKYLDAIARCAYDMGDYDRALVLYSYAGLCGADLARSLLCMAKCYLALGERENAYTVFDHVYQVTKEKSSFVSPEILEEVSAILKILKK